MLRSPSLANACGGRLAGYVRSTCTAWRPAGPGSAGIGGNGCGRRGSLRPAPEKRSPWVAVVERRRVLPALAERPREVADCGTVDLELNVMPWGSRPVARIEIDGLLVAPVALVVAAAVAQIDPTDERHVPVGRVAVADHEQLLVVAAVSAHTLVEQNLAAGPIDSFREMAGFPAR